MKKLIISLLFVPALLGSCIKDADVTAYLTDDKRSELSQSDPDKVFSATLVGMYQDLQQYVDTDVSHNYFGQKSFDYLTSLMGNDMVLTGRFAMSIYHYLLDYGAQTYVPTSNRWREYYNTIANANSILRECDPASTDPTVQKYRAIALGFRGYAYLQLTYLYQFSYYVGADDTKWGKGQTYDHSEALCVPLIIETTDPNEDQPRATLKTIHGQIINDLSTSYSLFESLGMVKTSSPTDMDGCVVANYLARAYMISHEWDNALTYAQVVIDNFPVLTTENDILQGFSLLTLPDVVFGCDITSDNTTTYMSWFSQMDVYGAGYAGVGVWRVGFKPLVDRIADSDIRLKWFCCDRSTGVTENGKRVTKLRDTPYNANVEYQSVKFIGAGRDQIVATGGDGSGWELGDYIYLRSEEAYLMKIEALAHKNDPQAVTELNTFMQTRQPDYNYTFTDKASLLEEIIFQKRVEFWGEGLEYLDNRRLNIPVDRTDATWGAENNNHFSGGKLYAEQEDTRMRYQLPISEIENNDKIPASDQNPL